MRSVTLLIDRAFDGVALTSNNWIHVSASYIAAYNGDVKWEIAGTLIELNLIFFSFKS